MEHIIIAKTEIGNYIVMDTSGGTYYDGDTYNDCLKWAKKRNIEIDLDDFRDYSE